MLVDSSSPEGAEPAIEGSHPGRASWWLLVFLGLAWGGITSFSMAFEDSETTIQAGSLVLAFGVAFLVFGPATLLAWANSSAGLFLTAHVVAAVASGLLSSGPVESLLRYAALMPAFSLLLCAAQAGSRALEILRLGLTLAGAVFVAFHFAVLDFGSIADPMYRVTVFLNTNGVGFISAMTALSAIELALRSDSTKWMRTFWFGVVLCCAIVLFGTKSRTAFLALFGGGLAFCFVRFRTRWARAAMVSVIGLGVAYIFQHQETVTHAMSLDEKDRSIQTGTGRYEIWSFLLTTVIPKNPWLGIGPGQHNALVDGATGSSSAHNAWLASLSEAGILGTLPLLLLNLWCLRSAWRQRAVQGRSWLVGLFTAGVIESLGESVFFSIGNPGSLLFMLAVAGLATPLQLLSEETDEVGMTETPEATRQA